MKRFLLLLILPLFLLLNSCVEKQKPLLGNLDLLKRSYSQTTLSEFLGNHRIIRLEKDSAFQISSFPRIIKRNGLFYFPSRTECKILDLNGLLINKIIYPDPLENEDSWVNGYDLLFIENDTELWIASGFMEQKIYCISLKDGQMKRVINVEYPFYDFRVISKNKILLSLAQNHYMFGIADGQGIVHTVGLKKKNKDIMDDGFFIPYEGDYLLQYPFTTLVGYYDSQTEKLEEQLLIEDNEHTNTWQKQTELIEKYGAVKGFQAASKNYYTITHLNRSGGVELVSFTYKEKHFFAIRRGNKNFKTMEIMPNKNNYLTDDISTVKDVFLQLALSFEGRTDSDDSILLYVIDDRTAPLAQKERGITIVEIFN